MESISNPTVGFQVWIKNKIVRDLPKKPILLQRMEDLYPGVEFAGLYAIDNGNTSPVVVKWFAEIVVARDLRAAKGFPLAQCEKKQRVFLRNQYYQSQSVHFAESFNYWTHSWLQAAARAVGEKVKRRYHHVYIVCYPFVDKMVYWEQMYAEIKKILMLHWKIGTYYEEKRAASLDGDWDEALIPKMLVHREHSPDAYEVSEFLQIRNIYMPNDAECVRRLQLFLKRTQEDDQRPKEASKRPKDGSQQEARLEMHEDSFGAAPRPPMHESASSGENDMDRSPLPKRKKQFDSWATMSDEMKEGTTNNHMLAYDNADPVNEETRAARVDKGEKQQSTVPRTGNDDESMSWKRVKVTELKVDGETNKPANDDGETNKPANGDEDGHPPSWKRVKVTELRLNRDNKPVVEDNPPKICNQSHVGTYTLEFEADVDDPIMGASLPLGETVGMGGKLKQQRYAPVNPPIAPINSPIAGGGPIMKSTGTCHPGSKQIRPLNRTRMDTEDEWGRGWSKLNVTSHPVEVRVSSNSKPPYTESDDTRGPGKKNIQPSAFNAKRPPPNANRPAFGGAPSQAQSRNCGSTKKYDGVQAGNQVNPLKERASEDGRQRSPQQLRGEQPLDNGTTSIAHEGQKPKGNARLENGKRPEERNAQRKPTCSSKKVHQGRHHARRQRQEGAAKKVFKRMKETLRNAKKDDTAERNKRLHQGAPGCLEDRRAEETRGGTRMEEMAHGPPRSEEPKTSTMPPSQQHYAQSQQHTRQTEGVVGGDIRKQHQGTIKGLQREVPPWRLNHTPYWKQCMTARSAQEKKDDVVEARAHGRPQVALKGATVSDVPPWRLDHTPVWKKFGKSQQCARQPKGSEKDVHKKRKATSSGQAPARRWHELMGRKGDKPCSQSKPYCPKARSPKSWGQPHSGNQTTQDNWHTRELNGKGGNKPWGRDTACSAGRAQNHWGMHGPKGSKGKQSRGQNAASSSSWGKQNHSRGHQPERSGADLQPHTSNFHGPSTQRHANTTKAQSGKAGQRWGHSASYSPKARSRQYTREPDGSVVGQTWGQDDTNRTKAHDYKPTLGPRASGVDLQQWGPNRSYSPNARDRRGEGQPDSSDAGAPGWLKNTSISRGTEGRRWSQLTYSNIRKRQDHWNTPGNQSSEMKQPRGQSTNNHRYQDQWSTACTPELQSSEMRTPCRKSINSQRAQDNWSTACTPGIQNSEMRQPCSQSINSQRAQDNWSTASTHGLANSERRTPCSQSINSQRAQDNWSTARTLGLTNSERRTPWSQSINSQRAEDQWSTASTPGIQNSEMRQPWSKSRSNIPKM